MKKDIYRWGIVGCGSIANKFAQGLSVLPDAQLVSVASKTPGKAKEFAAAHHALKACVSYEELAADPEVDVVYVATTHNFHYENTLMLLKAGKAVLCEKPFTINAVQLKELVDYARSKKIFLMEAMWTRFIPLIVSLRSILDGDRIGAVLSLQADFCFRAELDPKGRMLNPVLGGGALLDLGIYPVSFARMIYKQAPAQIKSSAYIGPTGVDEQSAYLFSYPQGQMAMLSSSVRVGMPTEARIYGTKGQIRVYNFFNPTSMDLTIDGNTETISIPIESTGYNYEAAHVMECLRQDKLESPVMPLDESLELMGTLDKLRLQWGLKYPTEA